MNALSTTLLLILAQAGGQPAAPAPAGSTASLQVHSAFDFLMKGGWPMIPIGICSLVAMAIIVERALVLRRGRVVPKSFVNRLMQTAGDRQRSLELCRKDGSPIARILEVAVRRAGEPQELLERHVEEAGGREIVSLRHRMRLLSSLPQVSTMLGLLGTVFGMIHTFTAVASTSEALGKTETLAKGIYEAWTCTAAGLMVAIPVLIAYHWLMGKIDALVADVDNTAVEFIEQEKARLAGAAKPGEVRRVIDGVKTDGVAGAVAPA